jgi:hypothetical protein
MKTWIAVHLGFVLPCICIMPLVGGAVVVSHASGLQRFSFNRGDTFDAVDRATVIDTKSAGKKTVDSVNGAGIRSSKLPAIIAVVVGSLLVLIFGGAVAFFVMQRSNYHPFVPGGTISDQSTFAVLREYCANSGGGTGNVMIESWWRKSKQHRTTPQQSRYAADSLELEVKTTIGPVSPVLNIASGVIDVVSSSGSIPVHLSGTCSTVVDSRPVGVRRFFETPSKHFDLIFDEGPITEGLHSEQMMNEELSVADPPLIDPLSGARCQSSVMVDIE